MKRAFSVKHNKKLQYLSMLLQSKSPKLQPGFLGLLSLFKSYFITLEGSPRPRFKHASLRGNRCSKQSGLASKGLTAIFENDSGTKK